MMTSLTLIFALVVGVVGVRVLNSVDTEITIDSSYLTLFETSRVEAAEVVAIATPEMNFKEIKIPVTPKAIQLRKKLSQRSQFSRKLLRMKWLRFSRRMSFRFTSR